jgi:hypothetical protein
MRAIREDLQRRSDRVTDKISGLGIDTMDNIDIKSMAALNMAGLAVDSIVKGIDFETTINQWMDAYIESYPPTMEDSMMKFPELYFNNNDTLDHYVRDIADSPMDIGAYKDQLDREIHQAATQWMEKNLREDNQSSADELERYQPEEESEDEYNGGRSSQFKDAQWRKTEEDRKRDQCEKEAQALIHTTHVSKAVQRFESKPMHSHCIPETAMLGMDIARLLYNEMYDDCLLETLPLTKITDLVTTGSCIPSMHKETDAIIKTISHAIMRRLMLPHYNLQYQIMR